MVVLGFVYKVAHVLSIRMTPFFLICFVCGLLRLSRNYLHEQCVDISRERERVKNRAAQNQCIRINIVVTEGRAEGRRRIP